MMFWRLNRKFFDATQLVKIRKRRLGIPKMKLHHASNLKYKKQNMFLKCWEKSRSCQFLDRVYEFLGILAFKKLRGIFDQVYETFFRSTTPRGKYIQGLYNLKVLRHRILCLFTNMQIVVNTYLEHLQKIIPITFQRRVFSNMLCCNKLLDI
jgi:hypothetical protein